MIIIDNSNIHSIINRFLDGETSVDEEKALYVFFNREDIPEDVVKYRDMFRWYASLGESKIPSTPGVPESDARSARTLPALRVLPLRPWQWACVAAMLAILLTVGFSMRTPHVPEEYLSYEGSYIVRDGKKITDLNIVVPEILRTQEVVDENLTTIDMRIEEGDNAVESTVLSGYDLSDPEVKELIYAALDL